MQMCTLCGVYVCMYTGIQVHMCMCVVYVYVYVHMYIYVYRFCACILTQNFLKSH